MARWTPGSDINVTAGPRPLADPDAIRASSPLAPDVGVSARGSSLWRDGVRRLRRNRLAMAGGAVIVLLVLVAIFADVLAPVPYAKTNFPRPTEGASPAYPLRPGHRGRELLWPLV